jgi:hypothetical protein
LAVQKIELDFETPKNLESPAQTVNGQTSPYLTARQIQLLMVIRLECIKETANLSLSKNYSNLTDVDKMIIFRKMKGGNYNSDYTFTYE